MTLRALRLVRDVFVMYLRHNGPLFARGIAYSMLLGSMPLLLLTLAAGSFFYESIPQVQDGLFDVLSDFLPQEITSNLIVTLESMTGDWAQFGIIGLLVMLMVSKGIFDSVGSGLIGIMGGKRHRILWLDHFYSLVLTLITVLIVVVAAMDNLLLESAISYTGATLPQQGYELLLMLFAVLLLALALSIIYVLYATIRVRIFPTIMVAFAVALLWYGMGLGATHLIVITARRTMLYGVFAAAALFLFWLQIFAHLVLLGGIFVYRASLKADRWAAAATLKKSAQNNPVTAP